MDLGQGDGVQLGFHQRLSWSAGKPIAVGELLRRLETLSTELQTLEQEKVDRNSITKCASELASQKLLGHKDKGVRAWTAGCLVDILRLCAPDAPYSDQQLKDIFALFVSSIIPALSDPQNPYNQQHIYVLESLAQVKSIVLLNDLPSSGSLILSLFSSCFDILASPDENLSKNIEYHMTGLLESVIDECQALPTQAIDIVLAQFLRADPRANPIFAKNKKNGHVQSSNNTEPILSYGRLPASYVLARNLCNTCVDRMARHISQYFGNVIVDTTSMSSDAKSKPKTKSRARANSIESEDDVRVGPSDDDIKQLENAHKLLRELWRSCPGTLQNVIPQIELELSAEDVQIRAVATEAIGDLAAGIGAAGLNPPTSVSPTAYPPLTLNSEERSSQRQSGPFAPSSPMSFSQAHISSYQTFLNRRNDKSPTIRALWATCVARILTTSAGGTGIDHKAQHHLISNFSEMLVDSDEKVRLAAVEALKLFDLRDFVEKIGPFEEEANGNSILNNLRQRIKDKKPAIRSTAIKLLGSLWNLGYGEMSMDNVQVVQLLGSIPSYIFDAIYVNDPEINCHIDKCFFDMLLPIHYPSSRKNSKVQANGSSKTNGARATGDTESPSFEADKLRVERLLFIVRDLDERTKKAFIVMMSRQAQAAQHMQAFLKLCEENNGGVVDDKDSKRIKGNLSKFIELSSRGLPDPIRAADDLRKFVDAHDRRCYALIRFCMSDDSDFKKLQRSLKELEKRVAGFSSATSSIVSNVSLLVCKAANIICNKSHVGPIIKYSQTNEKSLGPAAHELLRHISSRKTSVFTSHAEDVCRSIEAQAPSAIRPNDQTALDSLKTCSIFAKRYPDKMSQDRKFYQALVQFGLHGSTPKMAKHAVSIIMACSEKKHMYTKELLQKCVQGFQYGDESFLTKLACLSQLMLLAAKELEDDLDPVLDIAIRQVLHRNSDAQLSMEQDWQDPPDEECEAKLWALKILVNRLRCYDDVQSVSDIASQVYQLLNGILLKGGEISKKASLPEPHKARLRLQATLLHTKLCYKRTFEQLLQPKDFNRLAIVAQDPIPQVRSHFARNLMKQLGRDHLPSRFYAVLFLLAFEPSTKLKDETTTWIRARSVALARSSKTPHAMESVFARFLSLLAHHPDYTSSSEDLKEFARYIFFYLKAVATETNLSTIFHVAQRMKSVRDDVLPSEPAEDPVDDEETGPGVSENLYTLSDLAQVVIRHYADTHNWSLQAFSGKIHMPATIFAPLPSHKAAQAIAQKTYLPEEVPDEIEGLVKGEMRSRKRKAEDGHGATVKRRSTGRAVGALRRAEASSRKQGAVERDAKTKRPARRREKEDSGTPEEQQQRSSSAVVPESERRRSGRTASGRKSYVETGDSEDDELLEVVEQNAEGDNEVEVEREGSDDAGEDDLAPVKDSVAELADGSEGAHNDMNVDAEVSPKVANAAEKEKENVTPPMARTKRPSQAKAKLAARTQKKGKTATATAEDTGSAIRNFRGKAAAATPAKSTRTANTGARRKATGAAGGAGTGRSKRQRTTKGHDENDDGLSLPPDLD